MSGWTDERVALLKKYWASGLSASQIAARLGNVTRNAVISKSHRLRLSGRAYPHVAKPKPLAQQPRRPGTKGSPVRIEVAPYVEVVEVDDPPMSERLTLAQLDSHHCRWPLGDPRHADFRYCGRHKGDLPTYCQHHTMKAVVPTRVHRRNDDAVPAPTRVNVEFA